jgi:hypothetical protein
LTDFGDVGGGMKRTRGGRDRAVHRRDEVLVEGAPAPYPQ